MISAVGRAMTILEALSDDAAGATVGQLVARTGIEKSVVSRVLATLEQDGYVGRDAATDVFRVGIKFAAMALRHIERIGLQDLCAPVMRELAGRTGELVQLALVARDGLIYVAKAMGERRIQALPLIGTQAPLHASTAGKLYLASLPDDRALKLVLETGLTRLAPRTITSVDKLRAEIRQVRRQGYALLEQELSEDMNAIGVPVPHPRDGRMIGALMIGAPWYRFPKKTMLALVPELQAQAKTLGDILSTAAASIVSAEPQNAALGA